MYFEEVRSNLLTEALASPNLLSDLAGMENYIAESYNNRSFIELLQNADDAKASKFKIVKESDFLIVANNGRVFNQSDLESLCRSASSTKIRGETIGYRGIGFKSVVGFAKEIHIYSGKLEVTFSKELTKKEIRQAALVPLIRIPHKISNINQKRFTAIKEKMFSNGYNTIFIFTGIISHEIESEFNSFKYNSLLFLKNITKTEIKLNKTVITEVLKSQTKDSLYKTTLKSNNEVTNWLISLHKHTVFAFSLLANEVFKIPKDDAFIHAFLPTEEISSIGVLINGNFSTDPSRRHLIYDSETKECIKQCSIHIKALIKENIYKKDQYSIGIVNALIPYIDPRMLKFQKNSFLKLLLDDLKLSDSEYFKQINLPPDWLNYNDYLKLIPESQNSLSIQILDIEGIIPFLKFLGACTNDFNSIKNKINNTDVSILGCVQITNYIFKDILTLNKIIEKEEISELKIFYSDGERKSFNDLTNTSKLDDSFLSLLLENGATEYDIKHVFKKFSLEYSNNPDEIITNYIDDVSVCKEIESSVEKWFNNSNQNDIINTPSPSAKRWRSAEEQTLQVFNMNGFKLEDVSKQNIGYDLSGIDPNGNEVQIEVKSITLPGQKFKLTNNEIAVAQVKQNSYFIAIVRQTEEFLEISLISDPVNNLVLNRQCVQWIWECESYKSNPIKFKI